MSFPLKRLLDWLSIEFIALRSSASWLETLLLLALHLELVPDIDMGLLSESHLLQLDMHSTTSLEDEEFSIKIESMWKGKKKA